MTLALYTAAKNVFNVLNRDHTKDDLDRAFHLLKEAVDDFEKSIDTAEE